MTLRSAVFLLVALAASGPARAQIEVEMDNGFAFKLSGTVQPRVSVSAEEGSADRERFGFGVRRARFSSNVTWQGRYGVEFEVGGASGEIRPVDMYGFAYLSDRVELRAGLVPGAQPRAGDPTSHREIDAVERAAIAGRWGAGTTGTSGRDVGVDVRYDDGETVLWVFVHDGSGLYERDQANFRETITSSSVTRGTDRMKVAVSGVASHAPPSLPGIEVGVHGGVNAGGNPRTAVDDVERSYTTGSAYLYWGAAPGSQPIRLKADALVIGYEATDTVEPQTAAGVSGLAAVRVLGHGEVFGRAEAFWPDAGPTETYLTAGASYSASAAAGGRYRTARLTGAYAWREVAGASAHLVVLQGQFAF